MTTSANSVSVSSRHTIHSANESTWKALDSPFRLGAFDQVAGFVPIQVVWVYGQPIDSDVQILSAERLQHALTLLLDYYPHLTGRLQVSNGIREIVRLGTGAELLLAQCSKRLDAFSSPLIQDLPDAGNALLAPFDPTPEAVCRDPIFAVQHTRFACGGVALGVRVHHTVCDADGFFQLVRDLAELYRGLLSSGGAASLAHSPHIRPYMSELVGGNMTPEEREAALGFSTASFRTESTSSSPATVYLPPLSPVVGRFLRFSTPELADLKAKATDPNGDGWVSTFDALSAHIYQRVHRARLQLYASDPTLGDLSPTDFLMPVNLRAPLGLPPRYFHNTLFTSSKIIPPDVLAGPLWKVAKAVHDIGRSSALTKDQVNASLKWVAAHSDPQKIMGTFQYGSGSFMISQWNKFDMYAGSIFDGPPVLVSPPFTQSSLVDGLVYFLPTEELGTGGDAGAIDVSLSLSEPVWAFMDQVWSLARK
ncbi:transferase [Mycena alexandri]|uniref:Transferase n=1 Tax=Mycena alexandri TaxID=1745969 RepID=A0AAD6WYY4_9AGAR|nr:transferase [Mycena alexandri]